MKQLKFLITTIVLLAFIGVFAFKKHTSSKALNQTIQNGDLIFQESTSSQSEAIKLATHSKYTHCGIIYINSSGTYVLEASKKVKLTPLNDWINSGVNNNYVIKRLKNANAVLTPSATIKLNKVGRGFLGKQYDKAFGWSDDKIYCSELIWKIYKMAVGVEIGETQKLRDFDLRSKPVLTKIKERYGNKIPYNEVVISPKAVFDSDLLVTVIDN
jgi:uncharacterized protein YycO